MLFRSPKFSVCLVLCIPFLVPKNVGIPEEKKDSDRELEAAIAYEFGIWGGATHPFSHTHKGGKHPKFWLGDDWIDEKPTYQGRELIDLVRKLLDIPFLTHNRPRN